jgi:hypothetical protein
MGQRLRAWGLAVERNEEEPAIDDSEVLVSLRGYGTVWVPQSSVCDAIGEINK